MRNQAGILAYWLVVGVLFLVGTNDLTGQRLEHGVILSPSLITNLGSYPKKKGAGIEGGYYLLKKFGDRAMISIGGHLRYQDWSVEYDNLLSTVNFGFYDTLRTDQSGKAHFSEFGVTVPLIFRYQVWRSRPFYLLLGLNFSMDFDQKADWNYTEVVRNTYTQMDVSRKEGLYEALETEAITFGIPTIGVGMSKKRWRYELTVRPEFMPIDDNYLGGVEHPPILFSVLYRISEQPAQWKYQLEESTQKE